MRQCKTGPTAQLKTTRTFYVTSSQGDMIEAGHWLVLPYLDVWHATDRHISPLGIVPQQDCQPRPIVDYTFISVNEATVKLASTTCRNLCSLERPSTESYKRQQMQIQDMERSASANTTLPTHLWYESRPLTFHDTQTVCGCPYNIVGRRPTHCSPYSANHGMDGVTPTFYMGAHRDHRRPCQRYDCLGLHPGSISPPQCCGKYYAVNTYNDWMSAGLSRPTHGFWRCLSHLHLQQTLQVPCTPQTEALEREMPTQHLQKHYDSWLRK